VKTFKNLFELSNEPWSPTKTKEPTGGGKPPKPPREKGGGDGRPERPNQNHRTLSVKKNWSAEGKHSYTILEDHGKTSESDRFRPHREATHVVHYDPEAKGKPLRMHGLFRIDKANRTTKYVGHIYHSQLRGSPDHI
jgi:hypothetical protein